jgi:hypothetical protein
VKCKCVNRKQKQGRRRAWAGRGPPICRLDPAGRVGSVAPRLVRTQTTVTEAANDLGKRLHQPVHKASSLDPLTTQLTSASDPEDPQTRTAPQKSEARAATRANARHQRSHLCHLPP